jgi:hypothetical protein
MKMIHGLCCSLLLFTLAFAQGSAEGAHGTGLGTPAGILRL